VVATTIGAEGLGVTPGREALIADDAAGFADAVVALLRSAERRRDIGAAALDHVGRRFSWEAKLDGVEAVLRSVAGRRTAAATQPM